MKKILKKTIRGLFKGIEGLFKYILPIPVAILLLTMVLMAFSDCLDLIGVTGIIQNKVTFPIGGIILKIAKMGAGAWLAIKCVEIFAENMDELKKSKK